MTRVAISKSVLVSDTNAFITGEETGYELVLCMYHLADIMPTKLALANHRTKVLISRER